MDLAIEQAIQAYRKGEVPVGAVIVYGNEIVSKAHNLVEHLNDPLAHAEMLCIQHALKKTSRRYLEGFRIYCTLEPCIMCASALVLSRISEIVFILEDWKFGGTYSLFQIPTDIRLNHNPKVRKVGYRYEDVKGIMSRFFQNLR